MFDKHQHQDESPVNNRRISRRLFLQRTGALTGSVLGISLLAACAAPVATSEAPAASSEASTESSATPKAGGEIRFGQNNEPDTLDPARSSNASAYTVMMNLYDTLVWLDPADNVFKPGLAESWESSEDGLTHTFKLR